ncbi:hypothetical protein [Paenibacillus sacheonensis]|uniref:Uncharacterized protein n=1 Tax=Paenibacillus sacheonensis TaxID=742054 RepID=A0A7X5C5J0_9BACL|nr:hypothetical protein [Paenibacillus sacheonensis]MBM7564341.1 putative membrane protein [Paenibacillus sacheonensis]NBC73429.1 hypothetical protein [Paenibacillus sacheonensis]
MFWQQLWFLSNMVFVTLAIVYLFVHRAVTLARQERDAERLAKKKKLRLTFALVTVASFIVMVTFFLINMRVNR